MEPVTNKLAYYSQVTVSNSPICAGQRIQQIYFHEENIPVSKYTDNATFIMGGPSNLSYR